MANPNRRATVELVDAERALFRYGCLSCGHVFTRALRLGPRGFRRLADPAAVRHIARVWASREHVTVVCPKCSRVRERDRTGRYDFTNLKLMCRCGHPLAVHFAARPRPCANEDIHMAGTTGEPCDCKGFKRARS